MNIRKLFIVFTLTFAFGMIYIEKAKGQTLTLTGIGNGERVRLSAGGKSKIIKLEGTEIGDYTAGGDPPHHYTTLLSTRLGNSFYLVAKFRSGPALSNPNGPCGGDNPTTLMLIKASKSLAIEDIKTEIYASCIFNGAGRYVKGRPLITKNKISIAFEEGAKKYTLLFDTNEAEKGLQLIQR